MAVAGVEGRGTGGELPVQGVHDRRVDAIGHRQRREAAVIVNDIEAAIVGG